MNLSRIEINIETGMRSVIYQNAYINELEDIIVIDSGEAAPSGYSLLTDIPAEKPSIMFNRMLSDINAEYKKDVDLFSSAFTLAVMFDGPGEEPKKANIRAQYFARKSKYAADIAALREQLGA